MWNTDQHRSAHPYLALRQNHQSQFATAITKSRPLPRSRVSSDSSSTYSSFPLCRPPVKHLTSEHEWPLRPYQSAANAVFNHRIYFNVYCAFETRNHDLRYIYILNHILADAYFPISVLPTLAVVRNSETVATNNSQRRTFARRQLLTFYSTALEFRLSIILSALHTCELSDATANHTLLQELRWCYFHKKMSNHNLPLSSSRKQVQRSGEQFPSRYYYVINQKVNCDVKLLTDDGAVIYARKIDLADASAYFDAMFNRFDKMDKDHVVLKDLDSMALRLIVDYVYTDDITITEENVKDLLATANYLGFLFILHTCCEFLQDHLKPSNCLSTKAFADLHGCLILLSSSESYIKHNILEVIECDEFYSISSERVEELIKLIHYIEHTNSNEKQVIKCIMSWINREWNYRKHDLYKLLEHVNLPLTSKKCIIKGVDERSSADNVIENIKSEQLIAANIDKVILVFGWSSVRAECFIEWYDPEIKEWNLGPKISGYDTRSNLVERNGVFVYAVGSFSTSKSVYMLDLSSHSPSWISKEPMFIQRSELGVGLLNDWIYAVGGFNGNHNLNEVEAFNVHTEEWKMVSSMSTSRGDVGVGVLNNLLYAVGGFDELSGEYLKSVERYHPSFDQWTPIAEMSTCRSGHGVGVLNGLMYIIGGHDGPFYHKSVEVYNPDTGHWTSTTDMHVCRTNPGMGVVVLHGLLYVLGGRSAFYDNVSSVEIYNPNTKAWEYMETASSNVGKIYGGVVVNKFPHFITN